MKELRFTENTTLTRQLFIESDTLVTCDPEVWVTLDKRFKGGAIMLEDVKNIRFEHFNLDINSKENFQVGIFAHRCENIIISECNFRDSGHGTAPEWWTLMATNFRDTKNVEVTHCYSDGCQLKLAGGPGGIEGLLMKHNTIKNCTQMGISVVVRSNKKPTTLKDIILQQNTLYEIDDYGIYIGLDNGKGDYTYPIIIDGVYILQNHIEGLNWGGSKTAARGIQIRGTKDTQHIKVMDNYICDTRKSRNSIGIYIKNADLDNGGLMKDIRIENNKILNTSSYSIRLAGTDGFVINKNTLGEPGIYGGRGIFVTSSCKNGTINENTLFKTRERILNEAENCTENRNVVNE